jgi:predicted alpha/beta superfamily hydrolase
VLLDLYLPKKIHRNTSVVLLNDGQDLQGMGLIKVLESLASTSHSLPFITVGIHTNENRMQEYGTLATADYAGRGSKARAYALFITNELIPFLKTNYTKQNNNQFYIGGWSLGGLSAFDLAWNYPQWFKGAAVFSGSFWWRSKEFDAHHPDAHKIIMDVVASKKSDPNQKFWMMATDEEEKDDRNKNGIIDVVDDTMQLIELLKKQGTPVNNIAFTRLPTGAHHTDTWAKELEPMLRWMFNLR